MIKGMPYYDPSSWDAYSIILALKRKISNMLFSALFYLGFFFFFYFYKAW